MADNVTLRNLLDGLDDRPALVVTDDGQSYSRRALREEIFNVSRQLAQHGIKRGDVVSLSFENNIELIICFIATSCLGATAAPLNAKYKCDEVEFYLEDLSSNLLLVPSQGNKEAEQAATKQGVPVAVAFANERGAVTIQNKTGCVVHEEPELTIALPDDTALFLHTSGTTGKPKGVPLSHLNMITTMRNIIACYRLTPADRGLVVMPLFHVHGLMAALFAPLLSGGSIVLPANSAGFQAKDHWRHIARHNCTWFTAVPTMHQSLLTSPETFEAAGRPSLRFIRSCSSSLPPPVLYQLEEVFGAPVIEAYAMTEACHQMTSNPLPEDGPHKAGSVGRAFNVEVAVLDAAGTELPNGQVGEVCARGKNVTKGYHNRPEANAEGFLRGGPFDGFFRTGDLGYKDEEGYLFLTGRIKEQINRGGEKIAPVAIDNVLLECPGIESLFCFGAPHKELGETVAVVVVQKKGVSVSLKQLNKYGLQVGKLAPQWLPTAIVYCDTVPKGPTGKVQRTKLASMLGLPPFSAVDPPSSFLYKPGSPLERVTASAGSSGEAGSEELSIERVRQVLGDALGMELGEQSSGLVLDSFSAVSLSNVLRSQHGVYVAPAECINLDIDHIFASFCRSKLRNLAQFATVVEGVFAVDTAEGGSTPLPVDSFSAVTLCGLLQTKYKVDGLDPREVLTKGVTLAQLHEVVVAALDALSSGSGIPSDEPRTPEDFEREAEVPLELQQRLIAAAQALARGGSGSGSGSPGQQSIVLTGATGFLGSHILSSLLQCSGVERVFCIVRAASPEQALDRVRAKLLEQGLACDEAVTRRVVALCGDTSAPSWGLSEADLATLRTPGPAPVSAVIHNSAFVNHAMLFRALHQHNVASVHTALALAADITASTTAPCHCSFVSTGGVCGRLSFVDAEEPTRLDASALAAQTGYVQGKWVAERLVENAAQLLTTEFARATSGGDGSGDGAIRSTPAAGSLFSVFRPGAVTGHSLTGACNIGDSINRYIIGWSLMGLAPPLPAEARVDMSPVDWNAGAIAGIVLQHSGLAPLLVGPSRPAPVYTLDNGHSLPYSALLSLLAQLGRPITVSGSYEEWLSRLVHALEDEDRAPAQFPNPLRALRGALAAKSPKFGSTCCIKHMELLALAGYPCPSIDERYLSVYLKRFVELEALPPVV